MLLKPELQLLGFFCLQISIQCSVATPKDIRYGYPDYVLPDTELTNSAVSGRANDFLYNRDAYVTSHPHNTPSKYALTSPYTYQDPHLNSVASEDGNQQGLPQYYVAPAGMMPQQAESLLQRTGSRLASGLSGVLDVISASIIERKLRRLPPYYFYPPPAYYYYPYPSNIQDEQNSNADGKGKTKERKKQEEKCDENKKEGTSESQTATSNQHLKSWPKIFSIVGSGMDGFFQGMDATRRELNRMTGNMVSNGIMMGGTVMGDVTSGVAKVVGKISDL